MILPATNFKARLVEVPKVKKDEKSEETVELGAFTVGKKYRIFSIFDAGEGYTDFLCADDDGIFRWINISVFRK